MRIMPTVSVIIPAYNTAPYIKATLESVFAQTYTDYEIIVVNDGSPDTAALEEVLAPYRERIVYLKQDNQGVGSARNTAILAAQGPYVALLDSDDLWMPDYLRVQIGILERDPTVDALYPNAMIFGDSDNAGKTFMEVFPSEGEVTFASLVELRCHVFNSVTAKREMLFRAGLFDPDRSVTDDFEFWLRIPKAGGRIAYHRQVLAWYRIRNGSLSSDPVRAAQRAINSLNKAMRSLPLSPTERDAVTRAHACYSADLELNHAKRDLLAGEFESALRHLREANAYYRRPKLALAEWLMRFAPLVLLRLYRGREKLLVAASGRDKLPVAASGREKLLVAESA